MFALGIGATASPDGERKESGERCQCAERDGGVYSKGVLLSNLRIDMLRACHAHRYMQLSGRPGQNSLFP